MKSRSQRFLASGPRAQFGIRTDSLRPFLRSEMESLYHYYSRIPALTTNCKNQFIHLLTSSRIVRPRCRRLDSWVRIRKTTFFDTGRGYASEVIAAQKTLVCIRVTAVSTSEFESFSLILAS